MNHGTTEKKVQRKTTIPPGAKEIPSLSPSFLELKIHIIIPKTQNWTLFRAKQTFKFLGAV